MRGRGKEREGEGRRGKERRREEGIEGGSEGVSEGGRERIGKEMVGHRRRGEAPSSRRSRSIKAAEAKAIYSLFALPLRVGEDDGKVTED